jgi:probable FeS assembly SUF system protein SufT
MINQEEIYTTRDVEATVVPYGDAVKIPEGSKVTITHRLGGNFTVVWDYGMARIAGRDADAIGQVQEATSADEESKLHDATPAGPPDEASVWEALKTVFDPEIPVNIVDLGLVYAMVIQEEQGRYVVDVKMTLTAPGCGMGPMIAEDARVRAEQVPEVSEARVELVWDPPWHQEMISEEGKMQLGLI